MPSGAGVVVQRLSLSAQDRGERGVGSVERIVAADGDPDARAAEGAAARARDAEHVVAREVGGVVERAGRRLATRAPQRRRLAADGAEPAGMADGKVQGAEASHRDAADRDSPRVGAEPSDPFRNCLFEDVPSPRPVGAVVEVAVVAAVHEDDVGRARAEVGERLVERIRQEPTRAAAPSVQEDEHRPVAAASTRRDDDLAEPASEQPARQRVAGHARAARVGPEEAPLVIERAADEDGDEQRNENELSHAAREWARVG